MSLVVAGKVPVVEGQNYWLILQPVPLGPLAVLPKRYTVRDCWNCSLPAVRGMTRYSYGWYNGYNWWTIAANHPTLPAFGITAWPRPWADFFACEKMLFACQNGERGRHRGRRRLMICQGRNEMIANLRQLQGSVRLRGLAHSVTSPVTL